MQPTTMTAMVAEARRADLLHRARRAHEPAVTIRFARPDDRPALEDLAALDGRRAGWAGRGEFLVAELDGTVAAALPVERPDDPAADPFRRTREAVHLLRARAAQLRRKPAVRRRGGQKRQFRPAL